MFTFFPIFRTTQGHVLVVYYMRWCPVGHPIGAVANFELGTIYHPIGASISYTIPNSKLG